MRLFVGKEWELEYNYTACFERLATGKGSGNDGSRFLYVVCTPPDSGKGIGRSVSVSGFSGEVEKMFEAFWDGGVFFCDKGNQIVCTFT